MSKIFFLSSNTTVDPYPVYPLGMAMVAGTMHATGHSVEQYDCLAHGDSASEVLAAIDSFSPDFLAISMRNIDNVDSFSGEKEWYLGRVKGLIDSIRQVYTIPIIVGGSALTIMPNAIANYLGVNHAVVGEGEQSLPTLVAALEAGQTPPQVIFPSRSLEGDQFSSPLYAPELIDFYQKQSGMINMQTKRGCPYHCTYCTYPLLEGHRLRHRGNQHIIEEMARLKRDLGVDKIFFTDSVFNDPRQEYLSLVEEMLRSNLGMQWSGFFRPQKLGRPELTLMKRSGLYALELGTDATSDQTLAGIHKGLNFADILETNQACLEERLPAAHFVIFGGPQEDDKSLKEGLENMKRLGASLVFAFSGIRILPGTPLEQRAIEEGIIQADSSLLKPVYYFSPLLNRENMEQSILKSFRGSINRIFPPSSGMKKAQIMRRFGHKGLMWDQLVRFPREKT